MLVSSTRIINSLCQIDAPKAAVKRALSKSGIGMFGTGLTSQTTNDDSAPNSCEDWMPLISLLVPSHGVYFSTISVIAEQSQSTHTQGWQISHHTQWRER